MLEARLGKYLALLTTGTAPNALGLLWWGAGRHKWAQYVIDSDKDWALGCQAKGVLRHGYARSEGA